MKNKGFTLIELLAVIVILAIIALIATPMILGVIDTAKRGSAESSALGYVESVEKSIMLQQVNGGAALAAGTYYVTSTGDLASTSATGTKALDVDFKGAIPTGTVTVGTNGSVTAAKLTFASIHANEVTYDGSKAKIAS
mgnify:FL=1